MLDFIIYYHQFINPNILYNMEEIEHVVTEEDLVANPELVDAGVEVGDTIGIPVEDETEVTEEVEA